ncbi:hypothetical protein [Lysinibacillus sphaericus]|uniref:hypothetical protein n=1 Tax=Lysinibacillus sphaericus TaxID=1421 RepID=UPI003CFE490F
MKFKLRKFEMVSVEGEAHVHFVIGRNGEILECTVPLLKQNKEDVLFLQSIYSLITTKLIQREGETD